MVFNKSRGSAFSYPPRSCIRNLAGWEMKMQEEDVLQQIKNYRQKIEHFYTIDEQIKKTETEKRRLLRKQQTFTEKILWIHLRKRQALGYKFRRQYSVDHFVIDFYCPELKLAVELDGDVHEIPEQKNYDKARQKYLEEFGIKFIRITNDEFLGNPNKAFMRIEYLIKELSENVE